MRELADTIEQLGDNVAALDLRPGDQARARLDEIFPGYRTGGLRLVKRPLAAAAS
jgi:hypothetical protein